MPFNPTTAIPVRERPDGLLEKDNFDPSSAVPVSDFTILTAGKRQKEYSPPLTDEDRARALVELSYRQKGEDLPLNLKIDWTLTSPKARAITTAGIMTALTGGLYPVVQGLRGIMDNKEEANMLDAATKGILYPEAVGKFTDPLMDKEAPNWVKLIQSVSEDIVAYGAAGLAKGMLKSELVVRDLTRKLDKAATMFAEEKIGSITKMPGLLTEKTARMARNIDQLKSAYINDVLGRLAATDVGTLTTGFQDFARRQSIIRMLADEMSLKGVSAGLSIKPKVGQYVSFSPEKGVNLYGKIKEIAGNRFIIDMGGKEVIAIASQLSKFNVPATPLHAEALNFDRVEDFVKNKSDISKDVLFPIASKLNKEVLQELSNNKNLEYYEDIPFIDTPEGLIAVDDYIKKQLPEDTDVSKEVADAKKQLFNLISKGIPLDRISINDLVGAIDYQNVGSDELGVRALLAQRKLSEYLMSDKAENDLKAFLSEEIYRKQEYINKVDQPTEGWMFSSKNPDVVSQYQNELKWLRELTGEEKLTAIWNEAHGSLKPPAEPPVKTAVSPGPEELPKQPKTSKVKRIVNKSTRVTKDKGKAVSERTAFLQSLKDRVKAARQARDFTREEIFETQKMLTDLIDKSELANDDKAKFLKIVKNIQTPEDMTEAFQKSLGAKIDELVEKAERKNIASEIKKINTKGIAVEYGQAIENIKGQIDLKSRSAKTLAKREKMRVFVERMKAEGRPIEIPESTLAMLDKPSIKEISIDQLREILSTVESLAKLGKTKLKLRKSVYEKKKEKLKNKIVSDIGNLAIKSKEFPIEKAGESVDSKEKYLINLYNYIMRSRVGLQPMDGLAEATGMQYAKSVLDKDFSNYLSFNDQDIKAWYSITKDLTEGQLRKIGLYAAREQEGGLERLLNSGRTKEEIMSVELNEKEMAVYEFVLEKFEKHFPEVERITREVWNEPVEKVKNYVSFMADYDQMSDLYIYQRSGQRAQEEVARRTKTVEKGFTKSRAKTSPIKLELNIDKIFRRHLDDVAYMVTMSEDIKMLSEVVNSHEVLDALGDIGGLAWLQYLDLMARKGGAAAGQKIAALDIARRNVGLGVLGFRLSSALVQVTSLADSFATIGVEWTLRGASRMADKKWRNFVMDNFPEVRKSVGDDVAFRDLGEDWFSIMGRAGYKPLKAIDGLVRSSVAAGSYEKIAKERKVKVDLNNPDTDIIQEATRLMRQSQGSSFFKDQPLAITTGMGVLDNRSMNKMVLQFQSFMLNRWDNINRQIFRLGFNKKDYKKAITALFFLFGVAVASEIGIRKISRKITGADKKTRKVKRKDRITLEQEYANSVISNVPIIGGIWSSISYGSTPIPVVNSVNDLLEGLGQAIKGEAPETKIKGVIKAVGGAGSLSGIAGATQAAQFVSDRIKKKKRVAGN